MIRVYVTEDYVDGDGGWTLYVTGHASAVVCAGVSAIFHTMTRGLKWLAQRYPREVAFHGAAYNKPARRLAKKKRR